MMTRTISAVSALALALALAVPAHAQSTTQAPADAEAEDMSTLQLDALPEHEIERVQEHCDSLAEGTAAGTETDAGAETDASTGTDAAGADATSEQETPAGVNQSDEIDLSTITIEACTEAGFLNDDGTPLEGENPMSETPSSETDTDADTSGDAPN